MTTLGFKLEWKIQKEPLFYDCFLNNHCNCIESVIFLFNVHYCPSLPEYYPIVEYIIINFGSDTIIFNGIFNYNCSKIFIDYVLYVEILMHHVNIIITYYNVYMYL